MVYNLSEHFSYFHLNFWPGEGVTLLSHFFLILPIDPLAKVRVSSVVVVPIQVHIVAMARDRTVPPSPQIYEGAVRFNRLVVSILG